jgi:hypothetical protein
MSTGIDKGSVESTSLQAFSQGRTVRFRAYKETYFSGPEICRRARSRVGEDKYSILFNNCEHFATWCVTGKHASQKVDAAMKGTTNAVASNLIARQIAAKATAPVARSLIANGSTSIASQAARTVANQATRSLVTKVAVQGASGLVASSGVGGLTFVRLGITGIAGGAAIVPTMAALTVATGTALVVNKLLGLVFDW